MDSGAAKSEQGRDGKAQLVWMRFGRPLRFILLALCLVLVALPPVRLRAEFSAYKRSNLSDNAMFTDPTVDLSSPARSVEGAYGALTACDRALSSLFFPLQFGDVQGRVAVECLTLAESILADAPTLSFAHLVRAQALAAQGQGANAIAALAQSERTGGRLVWMAQRRLDIAFARLADLDDAGRAAVIGDIGLLTEAYIGADWLARKYGRAPELRPLIMLGVEQQPADAQARFLQAVRRFGA